MDQNAEVGWIEEVSGLASLAHQWLCVSVLGGSRTEWLLADVGQDNFEPFDPVEVMAFLELSVCLLVKIAAMLMKFFCIQMGPIRDFMNAFEPLRKESYITEHSKVGSEFALLLLRLLRSAHKVNKIDWPGRGRYVCHIAKDVQLAVRRCFAHFRLIPYMVCDIEWSEDGVKVIRMYKNPDGLPAFLVHAKCHLPKKPRFYVSDSAASGVKDELALTLHKPRPPKRPLVYDTGDRSIDLWLQWTDQMKRETSEQIRKSKEQFLSGSEQVDLQILQFFTPRELHMLRGVNKTLRRLIGENCKVPLEWAKKVTALISNFFANEWGRAHLQLETW